MLHVVQLSFYVPLRLPMAGADQAWSMKFDADWAAKQFGQHYTGLLEEYR